MREARLRLGSPFVSATSGSTQAQSGQKYQNDWLVESLMLRIHFAGCRCLLGLKPKAIRNVPLPWNGHSIPSVTELWVALISGLADGTLVLLESGLRFTWLKLELATVGGSWREEPSHRAVCDVKQPRANSETATEARTSAVKLWFCI